MSHDYAAAYIHGGGGHSYVRIRTRTYHQWSCIRTSYLTGATVAEMLSVSELTVRRKIRDGEIPAVKLATAGRGAVRIPEDGLETWLQSVRRPSDRPEAA